MPREEESNASVGAQPGRKKRLGFGLRLIWWANGLAALLLLVTLLAPHVSPAVAWPLALLAMSYSYQVILHALFIGWWLLFRPRRMVLSIMVVLLGWSHVGDHFQLLARNEPSRPIAGTPLKIMSWNVRLFDLYNWSHNQRTRDSMFSVLEREGAGILCLQEFFHSPNPRFFRTKDALLNDLYYSAVHDNYSATARNDQNFGIATFSMYPILDKGSIPFPDNPRNQCIWSDIDIGTDTIRVYNAHLASYHFGGEDHRFLDSLDTTTPGQDLKRGGSRILKLLRRGFHLRADEVERIAEHMAHSPHPVVHCGDLNDVPLSYSYRILRGSKRDAFRESGQGTGGTYVGRLPSFRIDHILHDATLESWGHKTLPETLSDHRPITCMIAALE